MDDKPTLMGTRPAFNYKIPIVRPTLPDFREVTDGVQSMLTTGMLTTGQYLRDFEAAMADYLGVRHAVAVSSCTMGLVLAYRGLGLTGDVIIPSFTFMATASALIWANLHPVFADVDLQTQTLDAAAVEAAITPKTSAIVAVHTFGNPADIDALQAIADRHGLKLLFDAAHGFGTTYQGVPVGSQGDAQIYSLSPTKLLVAGEGGIVATNHDDLAEAVRLGREYGKHGDYDSAFAGVNARMSEFHALLGLKGLPHLEANVTRRNELVSLYRTHLGELPGIGFQLIHPGNRCSYKDFSITIDDSAFGLGRDSVAQALAAENIDCRKYYDPPVHRQTAYRAFAPPLETLPNTIHLATNSLSLPIWSHMEEDMVRRICQAIHRIHAYAADVKIVLQQSAAVSAA
jgi:dTDP-4-amino-4,6-dideoxygalactose transaminase